MTEDKKGLLKSAKNIGDKNEELLKAFSAANKVRLLKMKVILIITLSTLFTGFTKTLKNLSE